MPQSAYPTSQGELIRMVRDRATQADFAKLLGVHPSCLSRYEKEQLGAPTKVLNFCLNAIAARDGGTDPSSNEVQRALSHLRLAAAELEVVARSQTR